MQDIGGSLQWVSSKRKLGDGFTKESAGALLAARLGHGRVKLTWDPSYTVAKQAQDQSREPQGHRGESGDGRVGTAGT